MTITSYEMMRRLTCEGCCHGGPAAGAAACSGRESCMAALGWRVVVVDESHNLRTTGRRQDAPHTEACIAAVKRAERRVLLSGTPSMSRPFDLFRQVDAVQPGLLGEWLGKGAGCCVWQLCVLGGVWCGRCGAQRATALVPHTTDGCHVMTAWCHAVRSV